MVRTLKGTSITLTMTFTVADVPTDPAGDAATIEVVRSDGTTLVPAGTTATRVGVGQFEYTLPGSLLDRPDRLTVRWTASLAGDTQVRETFVEVIGQREVEARDRLATMTAANEEPRLTSDEVADLVASARRADITGDAPLSGDWAETFDLNAAAAEGWRWKAGRVAGSYSSSDLEGGYSPDSFKWLNCQRMAEEYAKKVIVSLPMVGVSGVVGA